jgi:hypothetical protein
VNDTIVVTPAVGRTHDFRLELEYRGAAVVSPFGERTPAGAPVRFGWRRYLPPAAWRVRFIPLDSTESPPAGVDAVRRALAARPAAASLDTIRLDLMWYRPPRMDIPPRHVLTEASTGLRLRRGAYRITTIADDAIRVWIDDELVIDDWTPGESRVKGATLALGGVHSIRVEHLQLDGWYELRVDIEPVPAR